jgi:hypothetical protein
MYIDEYFDGEFYRQLPLNYASTFAFAQFYWTHAYYPHENLEVWRPIHEPNEQTKTIATSFRIENKPRDIFRKSLPLGSPKLEAREEFMVVRAKLRPVVLITPELAVAAVERDKDRRLLNRHRCLVAQVRGLVDPHTQREKLSASFVNRVRLMEFPQFMFLPKSAGLLEIDSLLRLDELQSVFTPHLDPTQFALGDSVARILKEQFKYLLTGAISHDYAYLREALSNN